jgi:hypothetical protein
MKTIAFCSCFNQSKAEQLIACAGELISAGKRVFLWDCNLAAPELHHRIVDLGGLVQPGRGFVDYLLFFQDAKTASDDLAHYVYGFTGKNCHILPAGKSPSPEYAQHVLAIDWKKLFPVGGLNSGLPLLRHLHERNCALYQPDFILIDLPPGITDLGCCLLHSLADVSVWFPSMWDETDSFDFFRRKVVRGATVTCSELFSIWRIAEILVKQWCDSRDEKAVS